VSYEFQKVLPAILGFLVAAPVAAQAPPVGQPPARVARTLAPEDVKKGRELDARCIAAVGEGRWDDAMAAAEELLALCKRVRGDSHFETVTCLWELQAVRRVSAMAKEDQAAILSTRAMIANARSLEEQGQYAQAQPLWEKTLAIDRRLMTDNQPKTASTYYSLAVNLRSQGRFAEALPLFEKALEIRRRLLGVRHPQTAGAYDELAKNYMEQGRLDVAQALLRHALEINRGLLGEENTQTACMGNDLALCLMQQGYYGAAEPLFRKALDVYRRLVGEGDRATISCCNNLASNLSEQAKYTEAQPLCEKALSAARASLGEYHPGTGVGYNNLAMNLQAQREYSAAEPFFRKALAIQIRLFGEGHPRTTYLHNNLAQNLKAQGRFNEARDQWLSASRSLEQSRLSSGYTGLERSASARDMPLMHLAVLLARLGQFDAAWQRLEEALARGLLDEIAARDDNRLTSEERGRLASLISDLERFDRLFEAQRSNPAPVERQQQLAQLRRRRDHAKIALDELRAQLALKYGPIAGHVASLAEIQAILSEDTALVAWVDIVPVGAAADLCEHWGAVVRARGAPAWFRLPGTGPGGQWTEADTKLYKQLREALRERRGSLRSVPDLSIRRVRAQRLDPILVALKATADGLPAARRLIVLPTDYMAAVPVEALLEPADPWTVSYAPSGSVLAYLRRQPRIDRTGGMLALGDPVFFDTGRAPQNESPSDPVVVSARASDQHFESLPGTRREVEALGRLFLSVHQPARILTDNAASEPRVYELAASGDLGRFAFIHLATHGSIDERSPERSAVILTQTGLPDPLAQVLNKRPAYDGRLTAQEIERGWKLKAELVTLSACETARGQYLRGEGFVGFTQALLMSGARSVCLSLWKVDDVATALLMERFYANLLAARPGLSMPLPKAEALAEAKSWLRALHRDEIAELAANLSGGDSRSKDAPRRKPAPPANSTPPSLDENHPYAHPYYWSAFVLVGNPD
jgi:CHAT domain-containing protein/Tfp pilus assembly protein PilF